ncbi:MULTISPECIES: PadR family transcriptional regulator [Oceanobacillus]|uniref:PadR family transcriptional regulator n=1 Tax=Oceanobacillus kimchii TaxID=746691 RepID=A0ABQ5TDS1_9BACI|nr:MULTISPECIES: PadR family transcriptional regulator [Oceanobacillus]MBT2652841.1 PadR family transcriptional regulator [Oceanobacillus sp. ISL-73]MCT1577385.1 PadR family transcriptional regulator [Oceanobacillus kimchii]MCT2136991.1 PadR family transcriptional regulator [Oceanobacillus kimchii]OEH53587.1 PadR family transcriptional regulator [Oceanobacillus sp. E9]GLO64898.1 PadR family transcriptional regulator [Oceanobacillus kimchii]
MSQTQMLKGILDGCLLAIIHGEECYGYEMAQKLSDYGFHHVSEGTIYPLLMRMQRENLVQSVKKASIAGPQRKYYSLTEEGKRELTEFITKWNQLQSSVNDILQKESEDKQ